MASKTKITYRRVGDFKIPNIILPLEQANITVGKWGMMHKNYIEHNKRGMFMLMQLEWVQRMGNIQQRAKEIVCSELIYS